MAPLSVALERSNNLAIPPPQGSPYSVPIPGSKRNGRSPVYRNWRFQHELLKTLDPMVNTVHEAFEYSANRVPHNRCLGHRPYNPTTQTFGQYEWQDYQTVQKRRANLGVGLVKMHKQLGIMDEKYGVGIWCQNRPGWQLSELAVISQGLYTVAIFDTLGPDAAEHIINHSSLSCVVTAMDHIPTLLNLKPRLPCLKAIISLDPLSNGELPGQSKADLLRPMAKELGVVIHYVKDIESLGEATPWPYNPPKPDDIVTINYTSGTTGNPKGVVLTHANAIAAASAAMIVVGQGENDVILSYLPLAHIYERVSEHGALWGGSAIGYFHGNIQELIDDLKLLRPTIFLGVPRLYNRFASVIKHQTVDQAGFKGRLSRHVVSTKLANLNAPESSNTHALYDRIWARKVSSAIGFDRCRVMVSGSAPLDPHMHQFLRIVFGNNFVQGYGLTETYAVSLAQMGYDLTAGNCGAPVGCTEVCLADVPDMDYLTTDKPYPRGELLIRSTALFREYFRDETGTSEAMTDDGWFCTGDICSVDELGRFYVIDRRKNLLKLTQGEYISPERIENVLLAHCGWMATAYVHGDSHQSSLVGIIGIAPDQFSIWAGKVLRRTIDPTNLRALENVAQNSLVRDAALSELDFVAKKNKFNGYERILGVRLFLNPFTVENDLLTPTLKLKRPQIAKIFRHHLDEIYSELLAVSEQNGKVKAML